MHGDFTKSPNARLLSRPVERDAWHRYAED